MESVQTVAGTMSSPTVQKSKSLWRHAFDQLISNKTALVSMGVVVMYFIVAALAATGLIASTWNLEVGASYAPPSFDNILGTDIFGRSVFLKMIKGSEVAMVVGMASALISATIGIVLGCLSGYFGGKVDEFIVWFYTTFTSIPYIMMLIAISFIVGKGIYSVIIALGLSSWVNLCRLIRGEVIKHKDREYVHAATAIGGGDMRKLFRHILPNVFHIVIINFTLQFQIAIKSEVILSYLGLGVQGRPSWGTMIDDSKLELARGVWWQLAAATLGMACVVLAFNLLGDALRDALDPKLKGK